MKVLSVATLPRVQEDPGFKRSARGRVLPSSVIEVRAVWLSPYYAELADLKLQRFGFLPAFVACCCPLFLSNSGQPLFLESPSNSSRLRLLKSGTVKSMKDCAPLVGYSLVQLTRL